MKIEWDDDPGRRPKASTVHGWLAKMRGTLLGDERLRSRGMREMREARAIRAYKREKNAQRRNTSGSTIFSLFVSNKSKSKPSRQRSRGISSGHQHPSRPGYKRGASSRHHSHNSGAKARIRKR